MVSTMTPEKQAALRHEFPANEVGILPKPNSKDAVKGKCNVCNGWHGLPAAHLDYVGHAAVTNRLLQVDPEWNWEPLAYAPDGLPALDRSGNLWIKLTICGVTRLGVGDGDSMKIRIGDALRNAAMRFGVALDLWSKEDLDAGTRDVFKATDQLGQAPSQQPASPPAQGEDREPVRPAWNPDPVQPTSLGDAIAVADDKPTNDERKNLTNLMKKAGYMTAKPGLARLSEIIERTVTSTGDITRAEFEQACVAFDAEAALNTIGQKQEG